MWKRKWFNLFLFIGLHRSVAKGTVEFMRRELGGYYPEVRGPLLKALRSIPLQPTKT